MNRHSIFITLFLWKFSVVRSKTVPFISSYDSLFRILEIMSLSNSHIIFPLVFPYLSVGDRVCTIIADPTIIDSFSLAQKECLESVLHGKFPSVDVPPGGSFDDRLILRCRRCYAFVECLVLGRSRGLRLHPARSINIPRREVVSVSSNSGADELFVLDSSATLNCYNLISPFVPLRLESFTFPVTLHASRVPLGFRLMDFFILCGNSLNFEAHIFASCFRLTPRKSLTFRTSLSEGALRDCSPTYACSGLILGVGHSFPSSVRQHEHYFFSVHFFTVINDDPVTIGRVGGQLPESGVVLHNFYVSSDRFTILKSWTHDDGTVTAGTKSYDYLGVPIPSIDTSFVVPERAKTRLNVPEIIVSPAPFFPQFATSDILHLTLNHCISLGLTTPGTDGITRANGIVRLYPGGVPLSAELQLKTRGYISSFASISYGFLHIFHDSFGTQYATTLMGMTKNPINSIIRIPAQLFDGVHRLQRPFHAPLLPADGDDDSADISGSPLLVARPADEIEAGYYSDQETFPHQFYTPFECPSWRSSPLDLD